MLELQHIVQRFGIRFYLNHRILPHQKKALDAIKSCRTRKLGGHKDVCISCATIKVSYNSCGNRNCPKCGNMAKEQWIMDRTSEVLPVTYFHTVFTIPHELNPLFLNNQKYLYILLFKAASETLSQLSLDKKFLGAQIGVTMVLHTWGQNLSYHPHVHCIVPGGGLSPSGLSFVRSRKKFFIPVRVLSKVFRGKFLSLIKKEHGKLRFMGKANKWSDSKAFMSLVKSLYEKEWVVYCKKPFKNTTDIVQYLSRYTHKTAIYNNRLTDMNDHDVIFRYRDYRDRNKVKEMSLTGEEFIRRFLLHVLPSGFQKIRYYGFMSNRQRKIKLAMCFKLLRIPIKEKVKYTAKELMLKILGKDISVCPHCGGTWVRYESILPLSG